MFEGLVASILNKWLGKYVEDLDTEQFNVGLFSGEVKLHNLKLKPEALFELELPIEVKHGVVGEISFTIPWSSLSNRPIAVSIERPQPGKRIFAPHLIPLLGSTTFVWAAISDPKKGLTFYEPLFPPNLGEFRKDFVRFHVTLGQDIYIVANPVGFDGFDAEKEKKLVRATRKKILDDLEGEGLFGSGNGTLLDGFLSALANNIQIFVKKFHLRYEDSLTNGGMACGVCIQGISIETTNSKWKPCTIPPGSGTIYQLARLEAMSFYFNAGSDNSGLVGSNWQEDMGKGLQTFSIQGKNFDFLVKPFSAKMKIIVSRSSEARVPKLLVDLVIQDAVVQLSKAQLHGILTVYHLFKQINLRRDFLHIRVQSPVHGNVKSWWQYSYKAVLQQRIHPYKWEKIKQNRENYRHYKELYKESVLNPGDTELRLDLGRAEDKLTLSSIVIAREHAKIEIRNEDPDKIEIISNEEKWWSLSMGNSTSYVKFQVRPDKPRSLWTQLSAPEKTKLNEFFGKTEEGAIPERAKKYIEHKINVTLHHFTASVFARGHEIASLSLAQFLGSFESRPSAKAFKISIRAESFSAEGASVEHGLVPILTVDSVSGSSVNFLSIDFEKNPLSVDADYGLAVNIEPTEFIYHEHAVSELLSFFQGIGIAENFFKSKYIGLKENIIRMKNLIEARKLKISANMNVKAPHIVIAETGSLQKAGMVAVLDLGKWTLRSDLQPPLCLEDVTQMELEERLYDRLHLNLDGFQLLFTDSGDEWRESLKLDDTDYHILSKIRGQIVLSSSIKPDYKLLPRTKLNVSVASIKLNLSDRRIIMLMDFLEGLPLPSSNTISVTPVIIPIEFENDVIKPDPTGKALEYIKNVVISAELSRQRTPDGQENVIPSLGDIDMEKVWASVDISDEDVELWARTVDLPGFDDNVSPNNVIKSLLRLVLGEIVIVLNRSSDLVDRPYLMARISKFRLDTAFMLYGPAIQVTLGGVQLIDKLHIGTSGEYLEILTTQSDLDFISILYRKVRSDCPDFRSHFHSVERSLVIDVGLLALTIHREAVLSFVKYLQYLYHKIIHKETLLFLPNLDRFKSLVLKKETDDPPIPPGAIKFSYSTHVYELRVKLCDTEFEFLSLKVGGFESDCMFKANERMVLRAYLSNLSVDDLSDITLYQKLISVEEDKVFELKYVRHSPRLYNVGGLGSSTDDVKSDGSVKLTVERIHVVLLYKMLVDLQHFIEPLLPAGIFCHITSFIRRYISIQLHQLRGWNARLHLSLTFHLPVLLIPQKVSSPNMILVNLGDLSVENFFKEVSGFNSAEEPAPVVDNVLLKLESAFCSRGIMTLAGSLQVQEEILEPIHIRLDVKRFVGGTTAMAKVGNLSRCKDIPIFDVYGDMEPVKITVGQKDLSTFLNVWNDNVAKGKFLETSWWWRASSPLDVKTPTENEDPLMKKLQAFLSQGDACRKHTIFQFSVDSVVVTLFNDIDEVLSSPVRDLNHGLCKLTLWEASFFLEKNYDSSLDMKMSLHNCLLEDIRNDPSVITKKVFQSHYRGEGKFDATISVSTPPIVDVAFKQTQSGDRCVDILVEKTRMNFSVSFLIAVGKFVVDSLPVERNEGGFVNHGYVGDAGQAGQQPRISESVKIYRPPSSADSTSGCYSSGVSCGTDEQCGLSVSLQCRKPEIMIFSTGGRKTRALLFHCEILADWSRYPGRNNLVLSLASLQAISKSHPANVASKRDVSLVLHQCDVEVARSVKSADDGMKITVTVSPVDLRLSTYTVAAIAEIFQELRSALNFDNCKSQTSNNNNTNTNEVEDLWSPKKILTYCDADLCVNEPLLSEQQSFPVGKPAESLTFTMSEIRVLVEVEYGLNRKPLFLSHSSFKLAAHDWSSLLNLRGELQLQANYFNESLGTWEPFIEPCGENGDRPWEIVLQIFQGKSFPISPQIGHKKENTIHKTEKTQKRKDKNEDSETSGDESDQGMTFLRPYNFDNANACSRQPDALGYVDSDSENEDAALEKLTSAVGHLFTGDSEGELSESGGSSASPEESEEEVETEDETASARSTAQEERAVFLKKHCDSVDSGLETEAVDRLATHVLIHSRDRLEITVTPSALRAFEDLSAVLSNEHVLRVSNICASVSVVNSLGPGAVVTLLTKTDPSKNEKPVLVAKYDREDSPPSSPEGSEYAGSPSSGDSDVDPEILVSSFTNNTPIPVLHFPTESLPKLYDRLTENQLLIQVPGFQDLRVVAPKTAGNKLHILHPSRNQTRYHIVLTTEYCSGVRRYSVRSPLQIRNETSYAMGVYYKKTFIESIGEKTVGETTNPFEDMIRLAIVGPDETFDVPLFVAYHCKLHFLPAHVNSYKISENGFSWQDVISDTGTVKDFCCCSKTEDDPTVFLIRAFWEGNNVIHRNPRKLPNCILRLLPPLTVHNHLSYAFELKLPQIKYDARIEPGDKTNIYTLDIQKMQKIMFEMPEYLGISWTGTLNLTSDTEEKVLTMITEQDTEGGNKQLALSVRIKRNPTTCLYIYSPYWIINKTGLPLQLRGSTSDFIHEWSGEGPLLFCYRKQRKRSVRLRAFTSSWSSAFSLDTPGCSGLVICKDKERKRRYRILVKCHLSQLCPELTKIIVFLPNFIVTNDCRKHLRFMEDNERADLWIDIAPGQCIPFWPETDSMRMYVKFRDSKLISQHFPVTTSHLTVLRMDKGCGITVEVSGGGHQPFSIRFRNYRTGDAPIRIDNQCEDLFLKFHQKELNQVALLNPYQSLLYTWDDPAKERILFWNVYSNKGQEFCVPMGKDGFGEERVSFHIVRPNQPVTTSSETVASKLSAGLKKFNAKSEDRTSSSSSDDSDDEIKKSQLGKKTRRDKVVVYWASYLEDRQRVLLFTQDERIARRARRAIDAERSHLELFLSMNGMGVSLICNDDLGKLREITYLSLSDSTARWEVMVAHRWKPLTVELAAWLEEKYNQGLSKTHIKNYIHIDFEKMQMTKPFFGELRRRHKPAIWVQYRRSKHMSLLHAQLHRAQIDNAIHDAEFPTILYPITGPPSTARHSYKPALEMAFLKKFSPNCNDVYKFGKIIVQEHCIQLERSWLCEMYRLYCSLCREDSASVRMRQDIALVHLPISGIISKPSAGNLNMNMIEYLHCSPIKVQISFSPQMGYEMKDSFNSPLVSYFLTTFASSLTQNKSAIVKLLFFEIVGKPCSIETVWEEAWDHYKSQLLQQLHSLVMGIDVLANPYSQFLDFTEGCHPHFYEPNMANMGIPEEFSEGLSTGALGFLGHETGGPAGSATLLAASLGTALQRLMNHEDLNKKKKTQSDSSAMPDSVLHPSLNFPAACSLGLSGVVMKPSLGNGPLQGVETFFRGPGKSLMDLMNKSDCDLHDCLSVAFYGIRRAEEMGENIVMRVRPPRHADTVLGVKPYSGHYARGLALLKNLCRGHYSQDSYWNHASLTEDSKSILLITLQHVFLVEKCKLWGNYEPIWTIRVDDLLTVPAIEDNKLLFSVRQEQNINSFWNEEKSVSSDDKLLLQWLKNQVEMVLVIGMEDKPCA